MTEVEGGTASNGLWGRPGLAFVDYRSLTGGQDGIALVNLDPDSYSFAQVVQKKGIGTGVLPHHLYYDRDENRLYTTSLGGSFLYELDVDWDDGEPYIDKVMPVNTYGNMVGEDIYFTRDYSSYYVTFMNGTGGAQGGSVVQFDAWDNSVIDVIEAPKPASSSSTTPYIMYPHGISANEDVDRLMVTSTIHPDLSTGVGNTVTSINMNNNQPTKTHLTANSTSDLSAPVEVFMLRDGLPRYALATTMLGGDIWIAPYSWYSGEYGTFTKAVEGDNSGISWPLEFYVYENDDYELELYVSFGVPGVVNVYSLDNLPALTLKRSFSTGAGAHHMVFFRTRTGREVVAVQNNLLNLNGLNAGTITVHDIYTGQKLGTVNLPATHGIMPEAVEWAYGHGHDYHH